VARDLAERLVGLSNVAGGDPSGILTALGAAAAGPTFQRTAGLSGEAFARALQTGTAAGYILSLDRRPLDPCRQIAGLVDEAGWMGGAAIVPLVDTRLRAIVRRERSGLLAEWDGSLLVAVTSAGTAES
jgi:hypothetical protein